MSEYGASRSENIIDYVARVLPFDPLLESFMHEQPSANADQIEFYSRSMTVNPKGEPWKYVRQGWKRTTGTYREGSNDGKDWKPLAPTLPQGEKE